MYTDKVPFEATITGIDANKYLISINSDDLSNLKTITINSFVTIYDKDNQVMNLEDLKVGDKIEAYYFSHYRDYNPSNIRLSTFIVNDNT